MKLRKTDIMIIIASVILCAAIVVQNFIEYRQSKELVIEDVFSENKREISLNVSSPTDIEGTIDINEATAEEIADFLPGIGLSKAENIVAYREAIGGYKSVEELIEVSGIGKETLDSIREYCRISD